MEAACRITADGLNFHARMISHSTVGMVLDIALHSEDPDGVRGWHECVPVTTPVPISRFRFCPPDNMMGNGVCRRNTHLFCRQQPPPRTPEGRPSGVLGWSILPDRIVDSILHSVTQWYGHTPWDLQDDGTGRGNVVHLCLPLRPLPPSDNSTIHPLTPDPEIKQQKLLSCAGAAKHSGVVRIWQTEEGSGDREIQARDGQHVGIPPPRTETSAPTRGNTERRPTGNPCTKSRKVTWIGIEPLDPPRAPGRGRVPPLKGNWCGGGHGSVYPSDWRRPPNFI